MPMSRSRSRRRRPVLRVDVRWRRPAPGLLAPSATRSDLLMQAAGGYLRPPIIRRLLADSRIGAALPERLLRLRDIEAGDEGVDRVLIGLCPPILRRRAVDDAR